ncbi:MAG: radical SAM protein [Desulfobacteraceae bacterium]|jgi:radical SAM superfamily enzyme YgiQ (UPF0313 family)
MMATVTDKLRKTRLHAESGTIHKGWHNRVRVALVYPNHYKVAMANLGFQTVYRLLNAMDHVVCERAFLPEPEEKDRAVVSLESARRLVDFDCVAFSISFENDYPNVLTLLHKAALPLQKANRGASLPLVLAGGVAVFMNPEPVAPFFDCFLLGEAEDLLNPFFENFDPAQSRRTHLRDLAQNVPGVYVPDFYRAEYNENGTLSAFAPVEDVPEKIKRVYAANVEDAATQSTIVTPNTGFEDAYLIEVSRGCPHGCRFCAAGYIYRPPRTRSLPSLLQAMKTGAEATRKIGLVGTAVSDLPDLKTLCAEGQNRDLQLSFSSLRADALDDELIDALKSGRLKTATIAPETGSIRMRTVINKGLDEEDILSAAEKLVAGGIPNLKLYFMVGLPTEQEEDVQAIVELVKQIKHRFLRSSQTRGRMGTITVSLNCFVPKPFTPFQWSAMDGVGVLKGKIKKVKGGLKKVSNVRVHADVPRWAYIQALLSRGDRRVGQLLTLAHENSGNWPQTFKSSQINADFYVHRKRTQQELLPWDFIDHGIDKKFLWKEYTRAVAGRSTPPCPMDPNSCKICGVCK